MRKRLTAKNFFKKIFSAPSVGEVGLRRLVRFPGWSDLKEDNFATDAEGRVTLQPLAAACRLVRRNSGPTGFATPNRNG